jgi:hypothetical protein
MSILAWIVIGVLAGWIVSMIMHGGYGIIGDLVLGILGALIGGWGDWPRARQGHGHWLQHRNPGCRDRRRDGSDRDFSTFYKGAGLRLTGRAHSVALAKSDNTNSVRGRLVRLP